MLSVGVNMLSYANVYITETFNGIHITRVQHGTEIRVQRGTEMRVQSGTEI